MDIQAQWSAVTGTLFLSLLSLRSSPLLPTLLTMDLLNELGGHKIPPIVKPRPKPYSIRLKGIPRPPKVKKPSAKALPATTVRLAPIGDGDMEVEDESEEESRETVGSGICECVLRVSMTLSYIPGILGATVFQSFDEKLQQQQEASTTFEAPGTLESVAVSTDHFSAHALRD